MLFERLHRNFTICPIPTSLGGTANLEFWSVVDDKVLLERDYYSRKAFLALFDEAEMIKKIITATYDYQRQNYKKTKSLLGLPWFKKLLASDNEMNQKTRRTLYRLFQEQREHMLASMTAGEDFTWIYKGMDIYNCKLKSDQVGRETFSIGQNTFLISSDINLGQISRKNVRIANPRVISLINKDYRFIGDWGETKTLMVDADFEFYHDPTFYEDAVKQSHNIDEIIAEPGGCAFPFRA